MSLWGGRFEGASDPLFKQFNDSLAVDHRLLADDIAGSIAWASAIERAGVINAAERDRLVSTLNEIAQQWGGNSSAIVASGDEDVHSFVERELVARVGPLGKKLHTGRSRNDQVATDLRLWTVRELGAREEDVRAVQRAFLDLAERFPRGVLPGYTHLQRAQPVLWAHWCLAYVEMLERDAARFADARRRAACSPLGSGALAGTSFPIEREALASDLGLGAPTRNSLDAVSDRDFAIEAVSSALACALHLSRLAEDLIVYSTGEFAFIEMGDSVTSGSSLMPQKKNPDAMELIRAKAGRILGAHAALAAVLKGVPLAYNKDLQEDKPPLFDAMDQLSMMLKMTSTVLCTVRLDEARARDAARAGHANSTDLADYLVEKGMPFRDAHEVAGRAVRRAISAGCALEDLPIDQLRTLSPLIDEDVRPRLSLDAVLARRDVLGGTAPVRVALALQAARERLRPGAQLVQ